MTTIKCNKAWTILKQAHSLNLPWICTSKLKTLSNYSLFLLKDPDKVVMAGSKTIICPGTLADMYKSLGTGENLHMYGKPYP